MDLNFSLSSSSLSQAPASCTSASTLPSLPEASSVHYTTWFILICMPTQSIMSEHAKVTKWLNPSSKGSKCDTHGCCEGIGAKRCWNSWSWESEQGKKRTSEEDKQSKLEQRECRVRSAKRDLGDKVVIKHQRTFETKLSQGHYQIRVKNHHQRALLAKEFCNTSGGTVQLENEPCLFYCDRKLGVYSYGTQQCLGLRHTGVNPNGTPMHVAQTCPWSTLAKLPMRCRTRRLCLRT